MTEAPTVSADLVREMERVECAAWHDFYAAASERTRVRCGLRAEVVGGAVIGLATRVDVLALNRAVGLGLSEPVTPKTLDLVVEIFRDAGVPRFFVSLAPGAAPEALPEWLRERGLEPYNRWVKLHRGAEPPPAVESDLRVERIDRRWRDDFGEVFQRGFEWDERVARWVPETIGRPGWHHYLAFDGDTPVATAGFYASEGLAWFDFAATLESHRGRGAQTALLARRIADAARHGCRRFVIETAEQTSEKEAPSYRNVKRLGFREAYFRPNWIWRREGAPA